MAADLCDWRHREPTDEEFAVMRALSDVRMGKGIINDTDVRLDRFLHRDAVEFITMSGALVERLMTAALTAAGLDPTRGPEQLWEPPPVRPTPESVELAALRALVKMIDDNASEVTEAVYYSDAMARARTIVSGDPRAAS